MSETRPRRNGNSEKKGYQPTSPKQSENSGDTSSSSDEVPSTQPNDRQ